MTRLPARIFHTRRDSTNPIPLCQYPIRHLLQRLPQEHLAKLPPRSPRHAVARNRGLLPPPSPSATGRHVPALPRPFVVSLSNHLSGLDHHAREGDGMEEPSPASAPAYPNSRPPPRPLVVSPSNHLSGQARSAPSCHFERSEAQSRNLGPTPVSDFRPMGTRVSSHSARRQPTIALDSSAAVGMTVQRAPAPSCHFERSQRPLLSFRAQRSAVEKSRTYAGE